jgi:hypothetical protein
MAITRAQQFRQMLEDGGMLVQPSMTGKRPGYRGDAAAKAAEARETETGQKSSRAATTSRSDPGERDTPGFNRNTGIFERPDGTPEGARTPEEVQQSLDAAKAQGFFKKKNPIEKFLDNYTKGTRKTLYSVFPNNPRNELDYLRSLPISQRALLSPALRAKLEALELDEDQDLLDTANTKFTFDEFEELRKFQPTDGSLNFAEYAAKFKGAPGLLYSGDVGNLEKYVTGKDEFGRTMYGYREKRDDGPGDQILFPLGKKPGDPNQDPGDGGGDNTQTGIGQAFRFLSRGGSPMDAPKEGIMQMASAPDPMDTRNDMMQNLAIDTFGKPLKDLTEDEIMQIEEMMMEMDQYGSKRMSRPNKMMADLDIKSMIDKAKEQLSESRFGKSYDELDPLEKELILEIIRGVGKDVFGERQMPESNRAMAQEGGIMDFETGRQMYFLGKLVKKATRAVKKVVKSPLGKAALGIAALKFGPGLLAKDSAFAKFMLTDPSKGFSLSNLFGKGLTGKGAMAGIAALSAAPLLFQEDEEEDQTFDRGPGLDIDYIRNNPYTFIPRRFAAEGGGIEPVAKKTMPLLDMGGKEMDLRENGGFVPIGRMEKADDVPARLSKNEFVFTADAVRNAGDGDVDKGAEVMYNMMKNLEAGGEVSEESQGLEGARAMFQTSKRLEEVL